MCCLPIENLEMAWSLYNLLLLSGFLAGGCLVRGEGIGMFELCKVTVVYTVQIYCHEETNRHSGAMVFLLGHFLSSIPFLFLVSISPSLVFYYLIGLRNEFSFLMYFVITVFMCLLANEAAMMIVAYIWLETYKCTLTLTCLYVSVAGAPFLYAC